MHVITWLDRGGAQETAMRSCALLDRARFRTVLVGGPAPSPEADIAPAARALGVDVREMRQLRRPISPLHDLLALVALVRTFRQLRPAIVHTHSSKAGMLGRVAARLAGVPRVVHTVHGWSFEQDFGSAGRRVVVLLERILATITDRLVVVTNQDEREGLALGIGRPEQYQLIRSGIDLERFGRSSRPEARRRLHLDDDGPVVGTVTRFAPPKDHVTLLRAFRLVLEGHPAARLMLVGDGPDRLDVEREIEELGLSDHVELLGAHDDIASILPAFDVFVFASRHEGLPRVVVEAMAACVPVVATDVGGIGEVVRDGATGLLVPPRDPAALASRLARLLGEPDLRGQIASAAAAMIGEFSQHSMAATLSCTYEQLLACRS